MENTHSKRDLIMGIVAGAVAIVMIIVAIVLLTGKGGSHRNIKIYELDGEATVTRTAEEESARGTGKMAAVASLDSVTNSLETIDAYEGMVLESGDFIELKSGYMTLKLDDDKYVYVEAGTKFGLTATGTKNNSKTTINLEQGTITNEINNELKGDSAYEINTPNANLSVRGTNFKVAVYEIDGVLYTRNTVTEGEVATRIIYDDGSYSDEEIYVPADKEIIIYDDGETIDYLTEVEDISDDVPTIDINGEGGSGDDGATSSELTTDTIKSLMDENLYVIFNIFWYGYLQCDEASIDGSLHQVTDPMFPDYASLENYLSSIYCEAYVNEILNGTLYVNVDGALYVDYNYIAGGGYYTDWTNATYEITSQSETEATFIATGTAQWPGEETTEPYTAEGTVVYENGRWVLTGFVE